LNENFKNVTILELQGDSYEVINSLGLIPITTQKEFLMLNLAPFDKLLKKIPTTKKRSSNDIFYGEFSFSVELGELKQGEVLDAKSVNTIISRLFNQNYLASFLSDILEQSLNEYAGEVSHIRQIPERYSFLEARCEVKIAEANAKASCKLENFSTWGMLKENSANLANQMRGLEDELNSLIAIWEEYRSKLIKGTNDLKEKFKDVLIQRFQDAYFSDYINIRLTVIVWHFTEPAEVCDKLASETIKAKSSELNTARGKLIEHFDTLDDRDYQLRVLLIEKIGKYFAVGLSNPSIQEFLSKLIQAGSVSEPNQVYIQKVVVNMLNNPQVRSELLKAPLTEADIQEMSEQISQTLSIANDSNDEDFET